MWCATPAPTSKASTRSLLSARATPPNPTPRRSPRCDASCCYSSPPRTARLRRRPPCCRTDPVTSEETGRRRHRLRRQGSRVATRPFARATSSALPRRTARAIARNVPTASRGKPDMAAGGSLSHVSSKPCRRSTVRVVSRGQSPERALWLVQPFITRLRAKPLDPQGRCAAGQDKRDGNDNAQKASEIAGQNRPPHDDAWLQH
jgi:hypothetical protein